MKFAATLVGLAIAASVAWFASEEHYSNCVDEAHAAFPLGEAGFTAQDRRDRGLWTQSDPPSEAEQAEIEDRPRKRRLAAIEGCSRLPW